MSNKLEELKVKVLKAQTDTDIASLYILEQEAHDIFDENNLIGYYKNILDIALDRLTQVLESYRKMDMNEVQDFATLRALYEYGIDFYSNGKPNDASAMFEVLSGLSNDKEFSKALTFHAIASKENISFADFIDKVADIEATQNSGTFYISCFSKETQDMLKKLKNEKE
jgi:hypothetical protein